MYRKILNTSKKLVPRISETESVALNSGTTSVEKYFFKGKIPKNYIWISQNQMIKMIKRKKIDIEARLLFGCINIDKIK